MLPEGNIKYPPIWASRWPDAKLNPGFFEGVFCKVGKMKFPRTSTIYAVECPICVISCTLDDYECEMI